MRIKSSILCVLFISACGSSDKTRPEDDLNRIDLGGYDVRADLDPSDDLIVDRPPSVDMNQDSDTSIVNPIEGHTCDLPISVNLENGSASIKGDTTSIQDEISDVRCRGLTTITPPLDGGQIYYSVQGKKDQWYRFVLSPEFSGAYLYTFTSTTCTEADIEADCRSLGVSGSSSRTGASAVSPRSMYFKAQANAPFTLVVDSTGGKGKFSLDIQEIEDPKNKSCTEAEALAFFKGKAIVTGDVHFVLTPNEVPTPTCNNVEMDGPQVYYKFQGKAGQAYHLAAKNLAGFGLHLMVFGDSCDATDISHDCSSDGSDGYRSSVFSGGARSDSVFVPQSDGTYYIAIDTNDDYDMGYFQLTVEEITVGSNGKCGQAKSINLSQGKWEEESSTIGLVDEFPTFDCSYFTDYDGPQAYYKLSVEANKAYQITYTPSFNSFWYIFKSQSCGDVALMNQDCDSDGQDGVRFSSLSPGKTESYLFRPQSAGDYIIGLDSAESYQQGEFAISVEEIIPPTNDRACNAESVVLNNGVATIRGTTYATRNEFGTTSADGVTCGKSYAVDGPQAYYELTLNASRGYKFKLQAEFNGAYIYVFPKSSCATAQAINNDCGGSNGEILGPITSSSSRRTLFFKPTQSTTYIIAVDSEGPLYTGQFEIEVEEFDIPTNDRCANAEKISLVNGEVSIRSTTYFATDEYSTLFCGTQSKPSAFLDGPQLYWSINLDATKSYAITASVEYLSGYVYLFDGSKACNELNITKDCQSEGVSGFSLGPISKTSKNAYFTPLASGPYILTFDSYEYTGDLEFQIKEFSREEYSTCADPNVVTLVDDKAKFSGYTFGVKNEFPGGIFCGTASSFYAGQQYHKLQLIAGREYYFKIKADFSSNMYIFSASTNCVASAIEAACSSLWGGYVASGENGTLVFRPKASGDYLLAIDSANVFETGFYTVEVDAFSRPTYEAPFMTDFEVSDGRLGALGDWEYGELNWTAEGCDSTNPTPPALNQGHISSQTHMWGTILNGCYSNAENNQGASVTCTSKTPEDDSILAFNVDLSKGCANATSATLKLWSHIYGPDGYDGAMIYINDVLDTGSRVCKGDSSGWNEYSVDLTQHIGDTARIEFHWYASTTKNNSGWYIDELAVECQ